MKITIDTKEDSKEDILRAVELLRSLAHKDFKSNISENNSNSFLDMFEKKEQPAPIMGMFDTPKTDTVDSVPVENIFNNSEKSEPKEEKPQGLIFLD